MNWCNIVCNKILSLQIKWSFIFNLLYFLIITHVKSFYMRYFSKISPVYCISKDRNSWNHRENCSIVTKVESGSIAVHLFAFSAIKKWKYIHWNSTKSCNYFQLKSCCLIIKVVDFIRGKFIYTSKLDTFIINHMENGFFKRDLPFY